MVNEELVADIQNRYLRGHRSAEIKKDLIKNGWAEKEIDDAISYLHRMALKQVPFIAFIINFWEGFEAKVANMSPRTAVLVLSGVALLIFLLGVGLYLLLDPLNMKSGSRDEQRNTALTQIQAALEAHFSQMQTYPSSLSELAPQHLKSVPKDPRTKEDYEYRLMDGGGYELCIKFEVKPVECFSGSGGTNDILSSDLPSEGLNSTSGFVIDGKVFMDVNNDKVHQAGESATSSMLTHVADAEGNEICNEITDEEGSFSCDVKKAGVYYVFLDATSTVEILGVNPQKVTLAPTDEGKSAKVTLRTNVTSPVNRAVTSAPTP